MLAQSQPERLHTYLHRQMIQRSQIVLLADTKGAGCVLVSYRQDFFGCLCAVLGVVLLYFTAMQQPRPKVSETLRRMGVMAS